MLPTPRVSGPTGTRPSRAPREDLDAVAEHYAHERDAAGDVRAGRLREQMISAALPMADRLARRYRGGTEPLADLEQVARLGLVKVVDRYHPERGSFTAYAVMCIVGELKRHLRDRTWAVHVPRPMQEQSRAVIRHETDLTGELGRQPTDTETARRAGLTAAGVDRARVTAAGHRSLSLDTPVGDGDASFGDLLGATDSALEKVADSVTLAGLIAALPERDRRLVVASFYGGRSQSDIAAEFGISQMQVSRLLARTVAWLREGLLTDRVPPVPGRSGREGDTFAITVTPSAGGRIEVRIRGEVDRDNAGRLRTALLDVVCGQPAGLRVVLQLGEVPLLDAAGVRVLRAVYESGRARGVTVTATGLSPVIHRIATVCGLTPMLADDSGPASFTS
ncbi:sigma-70 family RNA polymerase sigma factor [Actinoplanes couchii]|uniref:STAS domain-containing protein n=1 Tax=Actinoplanes couchii TaxID=403638 RepID=A0ABQ3XNL2_9ACTN|nr:sigma-70 family RNA polymerase sigma factor [Actinoplanes couchii]MDR6318099.1 RNA polymerase sigma-B factor [Actinoplanes couchii]GID59985.1 hypothetical protein Aco03nite_083890 [Actinoplanes couchii]